MKVVVVGNLAKRNEVKGNKKITTLAGGSWFAALQAAKLNHDVTLISKISPNFPKKWIKKIESEGIKLIKQPAWEYTDYDVEYHKDDSKTVIVNSEAGPIMNVPKIDCDIAIITSYIGDIGINVLKNLKREDKLDEEGEVIEEGNILALDAQGFTKYVNPSGELNYIPWLKKEEYLKYTDVLKLNIAELYYLTGKSTLASASDLIKLGPNIIHLTKGEKGAHVFYGKKRNHLKIPVSEPKKFIDKTGVGDVYTSAFVIRYKETKDIIESVYYAAAAASFCVEKKGDKGIAGNKKLEKKFQTLKDIFLI